MVGFSSLGFSTWGSHGPAAKPFVQRIIRASTSDLPVEERPKVISRLRSHLGYAVLSAVAKQLSTFQIAAFSSADTVLPLPQDR